MVCPKYLEALHDWSNVQMRNGYYFLKPGFDSYFFKIRPIYCGEINMLILFLYESA
ncbi:hypothetical protein [Bacillus gaemokensis]|uniref:hypothetical protein n=1 Tax=Bacillus gaemokensis TaxID=574375 RepID=UPI000B069364|nr:hypothetical protein [Bacillus gaemokensis]